MMGSGKTTVGKAVAQRLGWDFVDSDRQVEVREGRAVEDIWLHQGEHGFRELEVAALADAFASTGERPAVIAAAGGVVLDPRNRALLKQHPPVVWLRAEPATLAVRVGTGAGRPLLAVDPAATLARLNQARSPLYAEVATAVVDVDQLSPADVVDRVIAAAAVAP
jgi:shikimate kinase